jgi:excisionase family DNA binding protein
VSPTLAEVAPSNALVPLAYTVDEVATALRVSPRTIRNLLREGELVRRKVGSRTIIPRTSVEAFLRKDHATGEGKRKARRKKHGTS